MKVFRNCLVLLSTDYYDILSVWQKIILNGTICFNVYHSNSFKGIKLSCSHFQVFTNTPEEVLECIQVCTIPEECLHAVNWLQEHNNTSEMQIRGQNNQRQSIILFIFFWRGELFHPSDT